MPYERAIRPEMCETWCDMARVVWDIRWNISWHDVQAADHINFDGRSGSEYRMSGEALLLQKESVGATRLNRSPHWGTRRIAKYATMMQCLPAWSGVVVCWRAGSRVAFTMLVSRTTFTIWWVVAAMFMRRVPPCWVVAPVVAIVVRSCVICGLMVGSCWSGMGGWWWVGRFR